MIFLVLLEKLEEVEKWKAVLEEENIIKASLEQQLNALKETIHQLESEAAIVKQEKESLEMESNSRQEDMSEANAQLKTDLANKSEETNMLKESFGSLLADKEGKFERRHLCRK